MVNSKDSNIKFTGSIKIINFNENKVVSDRPLSHEGFCLWLQQIKRRHDYYDKPTSSKYPVSLYIYTSIGAFTPDIAPLWTVIKLRVGNQHETSLTTSSVYDNENTVVGHVVEANRFGKSTPKEYSSALRKHIPYFVNHVQKTQEHVLANGDIELTPRERLSIFPAIMYVYEYHEDTHAMSIVEGCYSYAEE